MKLNNYNGRWDWGVFWLHGIIGFIVGFILVVFYSGFFAFLTWEEFKILCTIVGIIFFLLAGFFGEKFWNKLKEYFFP